MCMYVFEKTYIEYMYIEALHSKDKCMRLPFINNDDDEQEQCAGIKITVDKIKKCPDWTRHDGKRE